MRFLVGGSECIRNLRQLIEQAGRSGAKVLITGESGVGKEVVAREIHAASSRARNHFVAINCAGVPDTLLESELFGHTRGAFTGADRDKPGLLEIAHGGTVFLDEVGEMSLRMQGSFLRFLEDGEIQRVGSVHMHQRVDVRVIAATNRDLSAHIAAQLFREDLFYRLNVIRIVVPPLREHNEDVAPLLQHFVAELRTRYGTELPEIPPDAAMVLQTYSWPGNIRELRNVVERLMVRNVPVWTAEIVRSTIGLPRPAPVPVVAQPVGKRPIGEVCYERLTTGGESFWTAVYPMFISRDLTREDLRVIIRKGLEQTHGSYKLLLPLFNMDMSDYKRFLNFLRKHDCHLPFQRFRTLGIDNDRRRECIAS